MSSASPFACGSASLGPKLANTCSTWAAIFRSLGLSETGMTWSSIPARESSNVESTAWRWQSFSRDSRARSTSRQR